MNEASMKKLILYFVGSILLFATVLLANPLSTKAAQCLGTEGYFCGGGNRVFFCPEGSNDEWELVADCNPGTCSGGACLPF